MTTPSHKPVQFSLFDLLGLVTVASVLAAIVRLTPHSPFDIFLNLVEWAFIPGLALLALYLVAKNT